MKTPRHAEQIGIEVFDRFAPRPGSGYIASGFALGRIVWLVERRRPERILEIGSGIGTITTAVLEARDRTGVRGLHVAVEDVPFCLEQFEANLGDRVDEVVVVPRAAGIVEAVGETVAFDLVIVDGGDTPDLAPDEQHTFTASDMAAEVRAWLALVAPGGLVAVENTRAAQRQVLEAHAGRPFVHEPIRPADASPGLHLYWFEPTPWRRAEVALRTAVGRVWFSLGLPLARRVYARAFRRYLPSRRAVATGRF